LIGRQFAVGVLPGLVGHRLARRETNVLQHQHLAWRHPGDHLLGLRAYDLRRTELDGLAQKLAQSLGRGPDAELGLEALAGRSAEVAHQDNLRAAGDRLGDRRQGRDYPIVVGDLAVGERHVEVHPHKHPLALNVDVRDCLGSHVSLSFVPFLLGVTPCTKIAERLPDYPAQVQPGSQGGAIPGVTCGTKPPALIFSYLNRSDRKYAATKIQR